MPYLVVYYATEDQHENNKYASILAKRFQRLSSATQGEVTVHGLEKLARDSEDDNPANAFALEYNSSDKRRDNAALLATLQDLIVTFNASTGLNGQPVTLRVESINPASLKGNVKLKL